MNNKNIEKCDAIEQIKKLPCFDDYSFVENSAVEGSCTITLIDSGLSHHCFKVSIENVQSKQCKQYFVKSLSGHESSAENELLSIGLAAKYAISANVIYGSHQWLVTEFHSGKALIEANLTDQAKIAISMTLLAKLHQIPPDERIPHLSIKQIVEQQLYESQLTTKQQNEMKPLVSKVTSFVEGDSKVLCHGDLNFSNIMQDNDGSAWLIDFECSFIGCPEFDVAMFVAVNNLALNNIEQAVELYRASSTKTPVQLDEKLIHRYLACCYLINGLWYQNHANNSEAKTLFLCFAQQQYLALEELNLTKIKLVELLLN